MDIESYARYRAATETFPEPMLSIQQVGTHPRTLVRGYHLDRTNIHVYAKDAEIHVVSFDSYGVITGHEHAVSMATALMNPSKRAFPERTDVIFAHLMLSLGTPLSFTTFDAQRAPDPASPFCGPVAP